MPNSIALLGYVLALCSNNFQPRWLKSIPQLRQPSEMIAEDVARSCERALALFFFVQWVFRYFPFCAGWAPLCSAAGMRNMTVSTHIWRKGLCRRGPGSEDVSAAPKPMEGDMAYRATKGTLVWRKLPNCHLVLPLTYVTMAMMMVIIDILIITYYHGHFDHSYDSDGDDEEEEEEEEEEDSSRMTCWLWRSSSCWPWQRWYQSWLKYADEMVMVMMTKANRRSNDPAEHCLIFLDCCHVMVRKRPSRGQSVESTGPLGMHHTSALNRFFRGTQQFETWIL